MPQMSEGRARLNLVSAMLIFGTIGIFVKYINMPSSVIAFVRGFIGAAFLVASIYIKHEKLSFKEIKKNLAALLIAGACIGANWITLFEAYRFTTVATATLCYYFAPLFVVVAASILFKERITVFKLICIVLALIGMVLVSGVTEGGIKGMKGILLGLASAVLYSTVILLSKKFRDISPYDVTVVQLGTAAIVVLPYVLLTENISEITVSPLGIALLLFVSIVHTGICYRLYFGSVRVLKTQSVALLSYLDPVVAIILSAVILHEELTVQMIIGAVLILGSALASELAGSREKNK